MKKLLLTLFFGVFVSNLVWAQERGTADEAVALVNKFIAYFQENGAEKAYAEVQKTNSIFKEKDLYIFVHKTADGKALMLAHGANPALIDRDVYDMKDADGKSFVHEFRNIFLSEKGEGWVDYKWPHPETKKIENKSTFVKKIDETTYVACGISK